jgi:hypothetical protein
MLLVSCHGGEGLENLLAYRDDGTPVPGPVLSFGTEAPKKCEFRGMCFAPDGSLWLLNGSKDESSILRFTGAGASYKLAGRVTTYPEINSLWHPFDIALSRLTAGIFASSPTRTRTSSHA